ncbi:MAG: hypothetical protein O6931_08260, partial [Gammaproteobacteria bacterium]|nr:hypothetical protein [Gammaproteobacteria bacterium]
IERLTGEIPAALLAQDGFVSSTACRACHPGNYQSWHDSFHRTMTQAAVPDAQGYRSRSSGDTMANA